MDLEKYLEEINTDNCSDCLHKKKEIVVAPPPDEILGIIVSRDPTVDWLPFYKCVDGAKAINNTRIIKNVERP